MKQLDPARRLGKLYVLFAILILFIGLCVSFVLWWTSDPSGTGGPGSGEIGGGNDNFVPYIPIVIVCTLALAFAPLTAFLKLRSKR
ncbi:MAG TPA: hypothetical protein VJ836_03365 [Candidatus Saccharimonadales bacterium]|nr:hypothetical protein [Candidatus Saccharimonadales bacterium]